MNSYQEIKIGNQIWMESNSNSACFSNGDAIPLITSQSQWIKASENKTAACCFYENNPEIENKYGLLYNWYAVDDPRGLAPKGWHIPSDQDWLTLINFLGGLDVAGEKLKSNELWRSYNGNSGNGNNLSGFNGLPSGNRGANAVFNSIGEIAGWWSSTPLNHSTFRPDLLSEWEVGFYSFLLGQGTNAYSYTLGYTFNDITRMPIGFDSGFSVRCIKG